MIGYVYLTTNDINDIVYVGKRQKPYFEKSYKGSGTHLKLAFKKYGKDKFRVSVIEWCETKEDLCLAEKRWIAHYRAKGAKMYNIAKGGDGGNTVDWANLPRERRDEINRKNSESHMGAKNPFYGRHHTDTTKEKLRVANSNRKRPDALKRYTDDKRNALQKIVQIDLNNGKVVAVWDNWCAAGKAMRPQLRCAYAHISECCNNKRKSAYGFAWEFAEKAVMA